MGLRGQRCLTWRPSSPGPRCPLLEKRYDLVWMAWRTVEIRSIVWRNSSWNSKAVVAGFCVFSQNIQLSHLEKKCHICNQSLKRSFFLKAWIKGL